jgi:small subunit ribosomal protein S10e
MPNLDVIKLMQSFKSKEYVRETFSWQHFYWYLTNEGIFLNLPYEIVPNMLKPHYVIRAIRTYIAFLWTGFSY